MLWLPDDVGQKELCSLAQHWVGSVTEELLITGEGVVVPHLQRNPDACGNEDAPAGAAGRREAPWICDCGPYPSRCATHLFCSCPARRTHKIDQREEWRLTLR